MHFVVLIAVFAGLASAGTALAQSQGRAGPEPGVTCPPDVNGEAPTVGRGSPEALSDKLAQSKGIICPPAGVDLEMQVTPPGG
jgi:hypothetical protein